MRAVHRLRLSYLVPLCVILSASTVAALALALPASHAARTPHVVRQAGPCGSAGTLGGTTCTYTTIRSDAFTVPAGVTSAVVDVVGAQGGRYFIKGDDAHGGSPTGDINGRPAGNGGEAKGTLTGLKPGQVLQVDVAGKGGNGTAASRSGGMQNGHSG
ncbi:MAG: hypothetical protein ACRDSH_02765, partial [Pseudonocardiaceae bacterium]